MLRGFLIWLYCLPVIIVYIYLNSKFEEKSWWKNLQIIVFVAFWLFVSWGNFKKLSFFETLVLIALGIILFSTYKIYRLIETRLHYHCPECGLMDGEHKMVVDEYNYTRYCSQASLEYINKNDEILYKKKEKMRKLEEKREKEKLERERDKK